MTLLHRISSDYFYTHCAVIVISVTSHVWIEDQCLMSSDYYHIASDVIIPCDVTVHRRWPGYKIINDCDYIQTGTDLYCNSCSVLPVMWSHYDVMIREVTSQCTHSVYSCIVTSQVGSLNDIFISNPTDSSYFRRRFPPLIGSDGVWKEWNMNCLCN